MKKVMGIFATLFVALILTACGGDDGDPAPGALRVLHASPDAPNVNVLVDGSAALKDVPYKTGSGFLSLDAGNHDIQVDGILPGGITTAVIGGSASPVALNVESKVDYTVIAVDKVASIAPLVISNPAPSIDAGTVRVQVVHAAPEAGSVDVYVTAPSDPLPSAPLGTFTFKGTIGPVSVPEGDYRIRVTPAGDPASVVFDTGDTGISLASGADLMIVAVQNTGAGSAPVSLVVLDGKGSSEILAAATPATVRVVHASPNAPAVDVFAESTALGASSPLKIVDNFQYTDIRVVGDVPPANDYSLVVSPTGTGVAGGVFTASPVELKAGVEYSVLAVGRVGLDPAFTLLPVVDENRAISTEARVKVIHGAPAAGDVDVYVTPAGTVSDSEILNGQATPLLTGFTYPTVTPYVALTPGNYDIRVVAQSGTLLAINQLNVALQAGVVASAIAVGPDELDSDPAGFGLLLLTN